MSTQMNPLFVQCRNCSMKHLMEKRVVNGANTECPSCRSIRYKKFTPETLPERLEDVEAEIRAVLGEVEGIGPKTVDEIEDEYQFLLGLRNTSVDQLAEVNQMNEAKAQRALKAISENQ